MVKAGLLLALFSGVPKHREDRGKLTVRGDPHVLVVGKCLFRVVLSYGLTCCRPGDPGLGKSQLLRAAANAAPRGVYVCGNTTTSAGMLWFNLW